MLKQSCRQSALMGLVMCIFRTLYVENCG